MRTLVAPVAIAAALMPAMLLAQPVTATLDGVCRDANGGMLPGVSLTVLNLATGDVRTAVTNTAGHYRVSSLPRGDYGVTAALAGFKTVRQTGVALTVGETGRLDFTLELGNVSETVEVVARGSVLAADAGRLSYLVSERQVSDLPLNGRNAYQLMELQPGTVTNTIMSGPFSGSNANGNTAAVNGQRNRSNNFLLDGIDDNDQFTGGRVALTPSVDMIQEFRMSTNSFSAEFGRSSSAAVSVITKAGTNEIHGTAYEFLRDDFLPSGRSVFDAPNAPKRPFTNHVFGGTSGGPVKRNKVFYFASYEGRRSRSESVSLQTVETAEFRRLVAERYPNSIANFLLQRYPSPPATQNLRDTGQPVPGLQQDHLDNNPGIATDPNFTPTGGGFYTNSAQTRPDGIPDLGQALVTAKNRSNSDQFSLRIDAELSTAHRAFGRYIYNSALTDDVNGPARSAAFTRPGSPRTHHLVFGHTWILSNRAVSETRVGLSRLDLNFDERDPGVPIITFNDGTPGFGSAIILITRDDTYHVSNGVSINLGAHGLKVGGEYRQVNDRVDGPTNRPSLSFQSLHDFAQDEVFSINSIGIDPRSGQIAQNVRNFRYRELSAFAQDDWRIRRNLTLNLGLRWEWFGRPTEVDGLMGSLILGPGSTIFDQVATATVGQVDRLMPNDFNNFGPRLGVSWDPNGKGRFLIRGGYGLTYDRLFGNSPANVRLNPPFYSLTSASPVFTAPHRGIPIPYGPTNPNGTRNLAEPLRLTGPDNNLGVAPDSGVVGNLIGWNPRFGTSTQSLRVPDLNGADAYYHNWFAGFQVDVGRSIVFEANYVGNVGRNLGRLVDYNTVPGDLFDGQLNRLNRGFGGINYRAMNAHSRYNALQLQLTRRHAAGFGAQIAYTLGKAMDDDSDIQTSRISTDARNLGIDWGASDFDVRHRVVANLTWELPWLRDASGLKGAVLGGWQLNGIFQYQTGYPFNIFTSATYPNGDFNGDGVQNDRPNLPSYGLNPPSTSNDAYMAGFLRASDFPRPQGVSGNLPRNAYRGPRYKTTDLSVFKNFRLGWRDAKLQLRIEAFNVFNTVNLQLQGFAGDLTSGIFARATSAFAPRQVQVAAKVIY
jgi:hypothetical protein